MLNLIDTLNENGFAKEVRVGYQTSSMIRFKARRVENGDYVITRISVKGNERILTTAYTPEGASDLLYKHAFDVIGERNDFLYFRGQAGQGKQMVPELVLFKLYLKELRPVEFTSKPIAERMDKQRQPRVGDGRKAACHCLQNPPKSSTNP